MAKPQQQVRTETRIDGRCIHGLTNKTCAFCLGYPPSNYAQSVGHSWIRTIGYTERFEEYPHMYKEQVMHPHRGTEVDWKAYIHAQHRRSMFSEARSIVEVFRSPISEVNQKGGGITNASINHKLSFNHIEKEIQYGNNSHHRTRRYAN